jgi:dephospho-CoA kinase
MLVVGLTGGIGSGKSTVADLFAKKGVPIIDADIIARDLTQPNQPALAKITGHFGTSILLENGELNRKLLRQIIFTQPAERQWLEACLHPLIFSQMQSIIKQLPDSPYCIAVIPLLTETNSTTFINRILVVDTLPDIQIQRVAARDNMTPAEANAILQSQASRESRLAIANDIITNHKAVPELVPQVDELDLAYRKLAQQTK